jgi:hypothetical protein
MWGARIKPRYPAFLAPMIILILAQGLSRLCSGLRTQHSGLLLSLAALVILANLPTYAVELYIRHASRDFHHLARRGAYATLIDIGGHLRKTTLPIEPVTFNRAPDRRVAHRLIGRPILIIDRKINDWNDPALVELLNTCTTRHAVIFVEHPSPDARWPRWHWPINKADPPAFYNLFERGPTGWNQIPIVPDCAYLRAVPPAP